MRQGKGKIMNCVDLDRIVVTDHALKQFSKRFRIVQRGEFPKDPMATIYKLLGKATEDHSMSSQKRVNRILRNDCKPTSYLFRHGWRFVICEDGDKLVVVTIEHISL